MALIEGGGVSVNGRSAKASYEVKDTDAVVVDGADHGYVGRGALKLKALLEATGQLLEGAVVVDVGASTGGFTEVCLEAGAAKIYAVDVGHGQLHNRLRGNRRVVEMEGRDARAMEAGWFGDTPPTVMVADVSFISLTKVVPPVAAALPGLRRMFLLVKPQFEVGAGKVGKGGIVRDEGDRRTAVAAVRACVEGLGYTVAREMESPIAGGDGNVEYLLHVQHEDKRGRH